MKLTVFGATGGIGRHVVTQALEAGHTVTAVVRDAARLDLHHPALTVVTVAGLTDPVALQPALTGADAVISGVGPRSRKDLTVASTATHGILQALEATGVRRFAVVSAVPVGPTPPGDSFANRWLLLPLIRTVLRGIYADLAVMEAEIRASAAEWTIVRPPRLLDAPVTGRYRRVVGANVPRGRSISRSDVATAMLAMISDPATVRQVVGVAA
ncbi:putative NADH-flavin reductase [Allocatelliglobosispora scoriae]|uniref:Putative NADH-flavin reductase n=1 Tax=Allocatelliglobosispora scoriae TaxID=643052 RepID=A0A841BM09_9ACTN|nr:NAD(P)H-binding protein [Allocatelliglobosispora scoriae]MBB5870117.1 putative NADH-flavin reductase [Allocatelliglobosispora scoriae]